MFGPPSAPYFIFKPWESLSGRSRSPPPRTNIVHPLVPGNISTASPIDVPPNRRSVVIRSEMLPYTRPNPPTPKLKIPLSRTSPHPFTEICKMNNVQKRKAIERHELHLKTSKNIIIVALVFNAIYMILYTAVFFSSHPPQIKENKILYSVVVGISVVRIIFLLIIISTIRKIRLFTMESVEINNNLKKWLFFASLVVMMIPESIFIMWLYGAVQTPSNLVEGIIIMFGMFLINACGTLAINAVVEKLFHQLKRSRDINSEIMTY